MEKRSVKNIMEFAMNGLTKTEFNAETKKIKNFIKNRDRESTREEENNGMDR